MNDPKKWGLWRIPSGGSSDAALNFNKDGANAGPQVQCLGTMEHREERGLRSRATGIPLSKVCSVIWGVVLALDPPQGLPILEARLASLPHDQ